MRPKSLNSVADGVNCKIFLEKKKMMDEENNRIHDNENPEPDGLANGEVEDKVIVEDGAEDDEDNEALVEPQFRITKKQRMALKLSDDTIEAIKDVFRLLDKDGSGTLDTSELANAMKSMGVECGDSEIEELMKQIDEDGNGTLDFFEFAHMVSSKLSEFDPEKEIKDAFTVFDINGDGKISVEELRAVVESLGGHMTEEELESMLLEADDNNDGYLDYSEFVRIWMGDDQTTLKVKGDKDGDAISY